MSRKWIYGKQDWKTFERGQENCYLMTNGFGGFSSLTMTGSAARNDHALFMACMKAPNNRYNMVHRLSERVEISGESYTLSSQEFADGSREDGYRYLAEFAYEDTPVWKFLVKGVQIDKEAALGQEVNTAVVRYRIRNRSRKDIRLIVTPFYQFTPKGEDPEADRRFRFCGDRIESEGLSLYFRTDGDTEVIPELSETYHYAYDACDGRRSTGLAKACHQISLEVKSGDSASLAIVYSTENGGIGEQEDAGSLAESVIREMKEHRNALVKKAGFCDETAAFLVKSARQFVSRRESTGGKTILAGFPFFEDWGRDTMIALPGVCISTGQYEDAESILRTFAKYERNGLMPNLFPEGKNEPMYNTADAALLFVNCVWLLFRATGNAEFVKEMYPVMERIIDYYQSGTDYNIHMDADGLIAAGSGLDQVTWMDVRAGDILPTPRHGKPVEINAYWYNALRIMGEFSRLLAGADTSEGCRAENVPYHSGEERYSRRSEQYDRMAEQAAKAFRDKFWMEEDHCLKDVVSGTKADRQIRCNQIWAVSMSFTMLDADKERQVVETVFEKLYTPYGLRTLDEEDAEFRPFYGGDVLERDLAYHQGTVWAYPLGAYYLAYLKVNRYSAQAKEEVRSQMEVLESALREGCIGQLPEIYDGADPVSSKGCFAQAWSVGEMLRVYEALEDKHAL